ncbi:hypothetical protein CTAYLR_004391 [Chrysophaeum taylorii]|uniref:Protein kinase domain-containing protein n=1 Tax=Chrysophaeum taylorii TaxID=2483200 RepID=A0AAD7UMF8_9STRA|nr:hypothetical protein CTAYLR_004391 [Chrysophaeum taylorii]
MGASASTKTGREAQVVVKIPAHVGPGQVVDIAVEDGRKLRAKIPAGLKAGQSFVIDVVRSQRIVQEAVGDAFSPAQCREALEQNGLDVVDAIAALVPVELNEFGVLPAEEPIARGSFGIVYRADVPGLGPCAVKRLEGIDASSDLAADVWALARLKHRNVVAVYGYSLGPEPCLVIELPTASLEDKLASLPWHDRLNVATDVANGLRFVHASNVVHGDLAAANILIFPPLVAKLSDFVLKRNVPRWLEISRPYIDPAYQATKTLEPSSDVYSFGVLLLVLLTGKPAETDLVSNARRRWDPKNFLDSTLAFHNSSANAVAVCADLAKHCLQPDRAARVAIETLLGSLISLRDAPDHHATPPTQQEDDDVVPRGGGAAHLLSILDEEVASRRLR